jgi:L-ascorbate metabolism protein UlaG (beta-lactamase superfamily)
MKRRPVAALACFAAVLLASCAPLAPQAVPQAAPGKAELLWLGQSAFRLTTPGGKVIVIDPHLRANPTTPAAYKDLAHLGHVDLVLVTHGHFDHISDAPALAALNSVPLYAPGDLNQTLTLLGVLPAAQLPRAAKGGTLHPFADSPRISITHVHAEHSSIYVWKNPATGKDEAHAGGEPVGYIIELENGKRIWCMGDTALFSDMKFIAAYYHPDLVMAPIGGVTAMDPKDAAFAMREWIRPKQVVAMHYGMNPQAYGTLPQFLQEMGSMADRFVPLKPGEKMEF